MAEGQKMHRLARPQGRPGFLPLAIAVFLFANVAGCSDTDESLVFRYGHSQPPSAPRSQSMIFFEEQLEQRSAGRISVELYFSGVLGSEREMMDMVATGVLQGTRGGLFADANPKYALFMLPFLVEDWDQALRLVNSELAHRINVGARANGFHVPATGISQGFRAHTNNVRPIRSPADFSDLKMRVPPQEVYVLTAQVFGASPQEMPASEIYGALRTGVLDGQDNPPSNIWDYNIYEVQKYMTVTNYSTGPDPFIVDLRWYEGLDAELQQILDQVAVETIQYSDQLNRKAEADKIADLAAVLAVNYLAGDDLKPFQALSANVYQSFIESGILTEDEIREARLIARGRQ